MQQLRRLDLMWQGGEVVQFEKLKTKAHKTGKNIPQFVKEIIEKAVNK
jgi:predicted DNA-binding protein